MEFSHFDEHGIAIMVDVSEKEVTKREALAEGSISVSLECYEKIVSGSVGKGDVLGVARIAGIQGAKRTSELIPLCHNLDLTTVRIDFRKDEKRHIIWAACAVKCTGRTGVEMEALTGVSIAFLAIYDMCKAIDRNMEISHIHLLGKKGGRSGEFTSSKFMAT